VLLAGGRASDGHHPPTIFRLTDDFCFPVSYFIQPAGILLAARDPLARLRLRVTEPRVHLDRSNDEEGIERTRLTRLRKRA